MPNNKKVEKKPYITIETDATGIDWNTDGSDNFEDTLTPREWKTLETLFLRHPTLIRISAPYRDPEIGEELTSFKAVPELAPQRKTKGSPGKGAEMNLKDWIFFFVHGFRYEASRMHPSEVRFLGDFFKEQTLAKPCQIEAFQFVDPYRVALLFFLDPTKPDFQIHVQHEEWSNLEEIIANLLRKYSAPQIKRPDLRKLLEQCKNCQERIIYGIDVVRNILLIYFTHDPRKKVSPLPLVLNYSKPQDVAEMVFRLNVDQASSYFIDKL